MRSAMMFRWISEVPPAIVPGADRAYRSNQLVQNTSWPMWLVRGGPRRVDQALLAALLERVPVGALHRLGAEQLEHARSRPGCGRR